MNQKEFNDQFENKACYQYPDQDYMKTEIKLLKECGKKLEIEMSDEQATIIWEHYSQAMDGSWLAGSEKTVEKTLSYLVNDPVNFWKYPIKL